MVFARVKRHSPFVIQLWYIINSTSAERERDALAAYHPLGPYTVSNIGAASAVSMAIGHNPGRVATLTLLPTSWWDGGTAQYHVELSPKMEERVFQIFLEVIHVYEEQEWT